MKVFYHKEYDGFRTFYCEECAAGCGYKELDKVPIDTAMICGGCKVLLSENLSERGKTSLRQQLRSVARSSKDAVSDLLKKKIYTCDQCYHLVLEIAECHIHPHVTGCTGCVPKCVGCKRFVCSDDQEFCCDENGCKRCLATHLSTCTRKVEFQKNRDKGRFTKSAFQFETDVENEKEKHSSRKKERTNE